MLALRIGGLTVALEPDRAAPLDAARAVRDFYPDPAAVVPDVRLRLERVKSRVQAGAPATSPPAFSSPNWRAWARADGGVELEINHENSPEDLYRFVELHGADLATGRFVCTEAAEAAHLLGYPTDAVLWLHLLARRGGLILHAAAVVDRGQGLVFAGASGAGKTTLSRRWAAEPEGDSLLLTDERCVVRLPPAAPAGTRPRVYGTPWSGEGLYARDDHAPIGAIFLLAQAEVDAWERLSAAVAGARLLACAFPPLWDPGGVAASLAAVDALARAVPCYLLRFRREGSCVPLIRAALATLTGA